MAVSKGLPWAKPAGEKYRPSNGSEEMDFMSQWCDRCFHDRHYQETQEPGTGCDILARAFIFLVDEEGYPGEWQWNERGYPCCTAFTEEDPGPQPLPNQLPLFETPE